jgi:hypothetical protein
MYKKMLLTKVLKKEIIKASNISIPIITFGEAPIALQIAISRLLSFKLENIIADIPINVVKITTIEIPNRRFSTIPMILQSS